MDAKVPHCYYGYKFGEKGCTEKLKKDEMPLIRVEPDKNMDQFINDQWPVTNDQLGVCEEEKKEGRPPRG